PAPRPEGPPLHRLVHRRVYSEAWSGPGHHWRVEAQPTNEPRTVPPHLSLVPTTETKPGRTTTTRGEITRRSGEGRSFNSRSHARTSRGTPGRGSASRGRPSTGAAGGTAPPRPRKRMPRRRGEC